MALESPGFLPLFSIQACPHTTQKHLMHVAGSRECFEASRASAVRFGSSNLGRRSTRVLTMAALLQWWPHLKASNKSECNALVCRIISLGSFTAPITFHPGAELIERHGAEHRDPLA
jgi:hypothetical protein